MDFEKTKESIKKQLKNGDIKSIYQAAGFITPKNYYSAMQKNDWNDLTRGEEKVIVTAIAYLAEREGLLDEVKKLAIF